MHKLDRPNQLKTYNQIVSSKRKFIIISAPTGFGKSALPAQLAHEGHKTLSLVATKSLQAQYVDSYNMTSITGLNNYDCLYSGQQLNILGQVEKVTAETCTASKENKKKCAANCPYPLARQEFLASIGATTNYIKFLLDRRLITDFEPEYLFCDEAHLLSDITVDYAGLVFNWKSKEFQKYGSPFFTDKPQPIALIEVQDWLHGLLNSLKRYKPVKPENGGNLKSYLWHKRRIVEIENTLDFIQVEPACWYVECDKNSLRVRPLTARFNFSNLFDRAGKIVLMSATIDSHTLRELGIKDYEFISVPNPWPAPLRPIVDLKAPGIGWKSSEQDLIKQAELIGYVLNQRPSEHTGLIHTTSKDKAYELAYRLGKFSKREFYVPDRDSGTEEVAEEWNRQKHNGVIGIFWQLWEGYDGGKDSIAIVGKVPYTPIRYKTIEVNGVKIKVPADYDTARFDYDKAAAHSRTAAKMTQGPGRIRRGNDEDYGDNKFAGIADGNWKRLKNYFSKDILESIY